MMQEVHIAHAHISHNGHILPNSSKIYIHNGKMLILEPIRTLSVSHVKAVSECEEVLIDWLLGEAVPSH